MSSNDPFDWRRAVSADYARFFPGRPYSTLRLVSSLATTPGLLACYLLRRQQHAFLRGHSLRAKLLRSIGVSITGADFAPGCSIGAGLLMNHPVGVVFGQGAVVGSNCTFLHGVTLGERYGAGSEEHDYPIVGDDVVIGAGVKLLGAVSIGRGAVIGANAVVLADVPDNGLAVGVPARVIARQA